MKSRTSVRLVLPTLLLAVLATLQAFATISGEVNRTDGDGLRQGYWIVKGYMTEEPGYTANATVEEGHYINGAKEGLWKRYYPSGSLRNEITYRNGTPYGPYSVYYPNGQVEEQGNWHRNKNVGEFARYYENGTPQQRFYFSDNGKRNGTQHYFHDNGELALVVNVVNGKEEGEMRRYYPNGKLKEVKTLNSGTLQEGSIKKYRGNDPDRKITVTENGAPIANAETEEPEEPNQAHRFEPNGYNVLYNKSQQLTQTGEFRNGRLYNGKWYRYNPNGLLVKVEIYQQGRYLGVGVIEERE
jgi:antitoxin component YwqK of YwqJK toxin-antitoxin module